MEPISETGLHIGLEPINIGNAEVKSRNFPSLMEAMGQEKYRAYKWGKGLNEIPDDLRGALTEVGLNRTSYSMAEYDLNGELKRHLFMEQHLENGVKIVFVSDITTSQPHLYRLENLYVITPGGKATDVCEEVDLSKTDCYMSPIPNSFYDPETDTLVFGDLDQVSRMIGTRLGIPIYTHEIGHYKDKILNRKKWDAVFDKGRWGRGLAITVTLIEKAFGSLKGIDNKLVKGLLEKAGDYGKFILQIEENASNYSSLWVLNKRAKGLDVSPDTPEAGFRKQLDMAFATYEWLFLGKTDMTGLEYIGGKNKSEIQTFKAMLAVFKLLKEKKEHKV